MNIPISPTRSFHRVSCYPVALLRRHHGSLQLDGRAGRRACRQEVDAYGSEAPVTPDDLRAVQEGARAAS